MKRIRARHAAVFVCMLGLTGVAWAQGISIRGEIEPRVVSGIVDDGAGNIAFQIGTNSANQVYVVNIEELTAAARSPASASARGASDFSGPRRMRAGEKMSVALEKGSDKLLRFVLTAP